MNGIDIHNISSLSVTVTLCPWSAKTVQLPIKANSLSPKILVIKPGEKKTLYLTVCDVIIVITLCILCPFLA